MANPQDQEQPKDLLSQLLENFPRGAAPNFAAPPGPMPVLAGAQPSDDPAITSRVQALDQAQQRVQGSLGKMQSINQSIAARPALDPQAPQYKPNWKDRLIGFAKGGLIGMGETPDKNPAYRTLHREEQSRQATLAPLFQQLGAEKEMFPQYKESADIAERQYQTARNQRTDTRLEQKSDADEERARAIANKANKWEPKEPKSADEAKSSASAAYATGDTKEGDRLTKLSHDLLDQEIRRARESRPPKEDKGDKPATTGQSLATQGDLDAAWAKAKREYEKAKTKLEPASATYKEDLADLQDNYYETRQDAQDAYEKKIRIGGGSAAHIELPRNHFGEQPSAAPSPSATVAQPAQATVQPANAGKTVRMTGPKGTFDVPAEKVKRFADNGYKPAGS